jgi:hypothetical protein
LCIAEAKRDLRSRRRAQRGGDERCAHDERGRSRRQLAPAWASSAASEMTLSTRELAPPPSEA